MNAETDYESRGLIPTDAAREYGSVHRFSYPHEVGGRLNLSAARIVDGADAGVRSTTLTFQVTYTEIVIKQDGRIIGSKRLAMAPTLPDGPLKATSCKGMYGACPPNVTATVTVKHG
jgi:hypothetical protein